MKAIHIIVSGRVQGVWFRRSTKIKADELAVLGTVHNLADGTVEIYAYAEKDASIDKFVTWCYEGPELARVDDVDVADWQPEDIPLTFAVLR